MVSLLACLYYGTCFSARRTNSGSTANIKLGQWQTTTRSQTEIIHFNSRLWLELHTVTQTNLAGFSNFSDVMGRYYVVGNNVFSFQSITHRNLLRSLSNVSIVKTVNNATPK
jgi:hypothetical protein